jgi:hypothetical protein
MRGMMNRYVQAPYLSQGFSDCELDKSCSPIKLNIMDVLLSLWK